MIPGLFPDPCSPYRDGEHGISLERCSRGTLRGTPGNSGNTMLSSSWRIPK